MLVNKTVEFFLSEAAGSDEMPAGAEAWAGTRCRRGPRAGLGRDTGGKITGQVADSERPGTGRDAGGGRG